ncbi:transposase [Streptomyces syringium]|uniref:transposase n=1 Tax=Streptomyces syringium TaxID=76729 RepID=UPI0034293BBB
MIELRGSLARSISFTIWDQHRAVNFRDFLYEIGRQAEPGLAVHVICDNLSAHEAPVVHWWLLTHPRFELHFTPTYSSGINRGERWFAELKVPASSTACSAGWTN